MSTAWITKEFLQNALEHVVPSSDAVLESYNVKKATEKSQNFMSEIHRVCLSYKSGLTEHNTSVILKSTIDDPFMTEFLEGFNVFQNEITFYTDIVQEIYRLLRTINDSTIFAPKYFTGLKTVLVLEDLGQQNYTTEDQKKRFDLKLCKIVMEKLAKFHAVTAVLYDEKPELFKSQLEPNLTEDENPMHDFYRNSIAALIKYVKTDPELKSYLPQLEELSRTVIKRQVNVFTRDEDEFNCLNQGDMWVNNIMFKKDANNEVEDVLLIDYQEGYYGSPAIDLQFFIYTSCNADVQKNNLDELIEFYHENLTRTLKQLNYAGKYPSLAKIHEQLKRKAAHG